MRQQRIKCSKIEVTENACVCMRSCEDDRRNGEYYREQNRSVDIDKVRPVRGLISLWIFGVFVCARLRVLMPL